jgi:hypothetical protein
MPLFRNTDDFDRTAKGNTGADRRRTEEADGARRKAAQEGAAAAESVLQVISTLPSLMASAGQAEAARLEALDPAHPRLAEIRRSADALARLAPVAARLRARATRGLAIARAPSAGLHGFVEDGAGRPRGGLSVSVRGAAGTVPRATTADDGYFVLPIEKVGAGLRREGEDAQQLTVVIVDKSGRVLHEDPVPLDATFGVGYREYVIDRGPDSGPDARPRGGPGRRSGPK